MDKSNFDFCGFSKLSKLFSIILYAQANVITIFICWIFDLVHNHAYRNALIYSKEDYFFRND